MADDLPTTSLPRQLEPLPYHVAIVDYLRTHEPDVWRWACSVEARSEHADAVRADLLKHTYRLDAAAYPALHMDCEAVAGRLGLKAPVTLYQSGEGAMNACLFYLPGEAHVVFTGAVLDRMEGPELQALLGHELAHHLLWERDGGIYHAADRILASAPDDPRASPSHLQTARLYRLYTEAFADRGGVVACGALAPAVSALIKIQTGLAQVSAASYLAQADEILQAGASPSQGTTHPEIFVRARALRLWCDADPGAQHWLDGVLQGPLALDTLDLCGQLRLASLTRRMLAQVLRRPFLRSEAMLAHARRFFPDFQPDETADAALDAQLAALPGIHDYVAAVLMDVATADRDLDDVALAAALEAAGRWGVDDGLERMALRELRLPRRQFNKLRQDAAALLEKAGRQHA
ncbi:MAG TPA: M48 family metalloprotease [Ramlibacter sp.]|nr:M48 family metalloprotease [Ramlibacter sp.]